MGRGVTKVNPCKVSVRKLAQLSESQLGKVWGSLNSPRASRRDPATQVVKNIVGNLVALKLSKRIHSGQERHAATRVYGMIVKGLEKKLRVLQAKKGCSK